MKMTKDQQEKKWFNHRMDVADATLAIECGEYQKAKKLIDAVAADSPSQAIAEELRILLEEIRQDHVSKE